MTKPHRYHDQPKHLEDVLNDVNEELYTTEHGLSFGAASLLRFLATIAWTNKTDHPEWYASINPKYAKIGAMAKMTGASVSSVKRYLKELDGGWIRRQHQYGRDGFRDEDRVWLLWSDADRKLRARVNAAMLGEEPPPRYVIEFIDDQDVATHDNRYWVRKKNGQFWRYDNKDHKPGTDEVLVELSKPEGRFFWARGIGLDTTKRRKIMRVLVTRQDGRAVLARMIAAHEDRVARRNAVA